MTYSDKYQSASATQNVYDQNGEGSGYLYYTQETQEDPQNHNEYVPAPGSPIGISTGSEHDIYSHRSYDSGKSVLNGLDFLYILKYTLRLPNLASCNLDKDYPHIEYPRVQSAPTLCHHSYSCTVQFESVF